MSTPTPATPSTSLSIDSFLTHMHDVRRCEESLRELNLMWRVIEASAKMNCPDEARTILPMMAATREGFQRLEKELVESLVHEKVANVLGEVGTKARHVIDIVVRNLYERTADVGFLATDRELCDYVAGIGSDREHAVARLRAYRDKYTVYDEIVLLDTHGAVLAHIDAQSPIEGSTDALIAQTLASDDYVETFRATDLRPGQPQALVYSRRMLHPITRQPVGVLCLVFGFESEMNSLFAARRDPEGRSNLLLLDEDARVIASADPAWIPVGAQVPVNLSAIASLRVHAGRHYLVQTYASGGYQGYPGPRGWRGQVMIPVDVAFHGRRQQVLDGLDDAIADGLLSHARSFCPPLHEIVTAADTIRRVVWNGQAMTAVRGQALAKLKTILGQVSETGTRTNKLFAQSIRDLYDTVLGSSLTSAESMTHLLVDLLDRNLYERADDCRWWAMTPELRAALAAPDVSSWEQVTETLEGINALYTVYTRLVVYDTHGRIVAASRAANADGSSVVGWNIEDDSLQAVLKLRDGQSYHVTPFRTSALYDNQPTFIYHAAIRALDDDSRVLGGIGIVFNAAPEFEAMLASACADRKNTTALFVNRAGSILSSTDPARPVGAHVEIPADAFDLRNGDNTSRVIVRDGQYTLLGVSVNRGYREFKVSDGYRDDVLALSFETLGEVRLLRSSAHSARHVIQSDGTGGQEFATFFVQAGLCALPALHVLEAQPASEIAPVSLGEVAGRVGMLPRRSVDQLDRYVWVFDLNALMGSKPTDRNLAAQVIVVEDQGVEFGLLVDELHGVPEFAESQITPVPRLPGEHSILASSLIKANQGELLIQVLDTARIRALVELGDPLAQPAPSPDLVVL